MDINYIALTREATQVSALTTRFVLLREEILDLEHARAFDFIFGSRAMRGNFTMTLL